MKEKLQNDRALLPRTDLALEDFDGLDGTQRGEEEIYYSDSGKIRVASLSIVTRQAEERLNRRRGRYVTVIFPHVSLLSESAELLLSKILADKLLRLAKSVIGKDSKTFTVLVVGLGNCGVTADSIGPLTADAVSPTSHIARRNCGLLESLNMSKISVFTPSVAGKTGMETAELVRAAANISSPELIVAVDALSSLSCERIGKTIQLTDAGISPGAGVGNHLTPLNVKTLGVPVISIGAPTVVDSAVLIEDALERAGVEMPQKLADSLIRGKRFLVCPRDCDVVAERSAKIISSAIKLAFGGV